MYTIFPKMLSQNRISLLLLVCLAMLETIMGWSTPVKLEMPINDMSVAEDTQELFSIELAKLVHKQEGLLLARTVMGVVIQILTDRHAMDCIKKANGEAEHFLTQERTPKFVSDILDGIVFHFGTEEGTALIKFRLNYLKTNLDNPELIQEVEEKNVALMKFLKDKYVLIKIGMGYAKIRKDMNASIWNGYGLV